MALAEHRGSTRSSGSDHLIVQCLSRRSVVARRGASLIRRQRRWPAPRPRGPEPLCDRHRDGPLQTQEWPPPATHVSACASRPGLALHPCRMWVSTPATLQRHQLASPGLDVAHREFASTRCRFCSLFVRQRANRDVSLRNGQWNQLPQHVTSHVSPLVVLWWAVMAPYFLSLLDTYAGLAGNDDLQTHSTRATQHYGIIQTLSHLP